jgi:uncharacterized membrane protein
MADAPAPAPIPDPSQGLQLVLPGRYVGFGPSVGWIGRSWKLFAKAPLMWILAVLVFFVFSVVLHIVPIIGFIASALLSPMYLAGFAVACRSLETGGEFEIDHLLAGFKVRSTELIIVGAIMLAGEIVVFLVFMMIVGIAIVMAIVSGNVEQMEATLRTMGLQILLGVLVMLLFLIPMLAAYWFAPFLVVMHGMRPLAAMKASLMACMRNFLPMAAYGLVMLVILLVVCIPVIVPILGWLFTAAAIFVVMIMGFIAIYPSYRDIFTEEPGPAAVRA